MARIVLVHGAFGRAACWDRVAPGLRAAGHSVEAIDLPGAGDDPTPVEEITLDRYAQRACEALAGGPPAVLVGHSMGGMVVTQAAARSPEHVARLVYVAAFLPSDGQSLIDITGLPEAAGDQVQANLVVEGEPPVATMRARGGARGALSLLRRRAVRLVRVAARAPASGPVHGAGGAGRTRGRSVRGTPARVRDVPPGPGDPATVAAALHRDRRLRSGDRDRH